MKPIWKFLHVVEVAKYMFVRKGTIFTGRRREQVDRKEYG